MHSRHGFAISLTAIIALTGLLMVGCQSGPQANPVETPAPSTDPATQQVATPPEELPTEQDKQLVEAFDVIMTELDETIANEIFNHLRHTPDIQTFRESILNGQPMLAKQLGYARHYFKSQINAAEKSRTWPAPINYTIARLQGELVIDGSASESAWSKASSVALNFNFNNPVPVSSKATAQMLWDDQYLYVVYRVPDGDIQTPKLANDTPIICTFDCAELFIMPNPDWSLYWEINASPYGPVYDALNLKRFNGWMSEMRIDLNIQGLLIKTGTLANDQGGPGYVMEMAIPWNQMPMPGGRLPKAGDTLKGLMGIAQLNIVDGKRHLQYLSHSPMLANFHNVRTMPELKLAD